MNNNNKNNNDNFQCTSICTLSLSFSNVSMDCLGGHSLVTVPARCVTCLLAPTRSVKWCLADHTQPMNTRLAHRHRHNVHILTLPLPLYTDDSRWVPLSQSREMVWRAVTNHDTGRQTACFLFLSSRYN